MNLHNLRIFLKVAELEHITRASEELNLSQPAVTKIIQSLEYEVNLDLVERQGRRIVLTSAGRVLQSYARQVFALEHEMEEALTTLQDADSGEVTLAANPTASVYLLPPIVAHFHARYPRVKLNIAICNSQEIAEGILDWKLDFGIVEGLASALATGLTVEAFAHDELGLIVAPNHRWSQLGSVSPEALQDGELLLREQGSGIREAIEQGLQYHNVQIRPLCILTDNEAIKHLVMHGMGAAIVSLLTVRHELEIGSLVQIPVHKLSLPSQFSLIQRADKHLSRAAENFGAFLRAGVSKESA